MPHTRGFQDGFIDLVEEQLNLSRQELAEIDERIADLHEERAAAAKRVEQLEELVDDRTVRRTSNAAADAATASPTEPEARKPFADADAVVNLIAERGHAMHYLEVYAELVQRGFEVGGKGQPSTLLSRYFNDQRLQRIARGTYGLAEQQAHDRNGSSAPINGTSQPPQPKPTDDDLWHLAGGGGLDATGYFEHGGIRVCAGSRARKRTGNLSNSSQKALRIREQMINTSELADKGSHYELRADRVFDSPSLAAVVMSGVSLNGWQSWKDAGGRPLDQVRRQGAETRRAQRPFRPAPSKRDPRPPMR